jgi:hypothetical protein
LGQGDWIAADGGVNLGQNAFFPVQTLQLPNAERHECDSSDQGKYQCSDGAFQSGGSSSIAQTV